MSKNIYCVIMAGGIGTRFWPKSRKSKPKQFLDILGDGKSFLRHTYERFLPLVGCENILVVTNSNYKPLVEEQLPGIAPSQILCEPIGRNTAPCIAYAAYYLAKKAPDAQMIVTPADHYITNQELFQATILDSLQQAKAHSALMTIGIRPTRPESGYGYIQVSSSEPTCKVKCFTEKPSVEMAQVFVQSGDFMWNSGIFIWSVKDIIEAFKSHLPEHHQIFSHISEHYGTPREVQAIKHAFSECKSISIDYGVMEKADNVYVTVGQFGWSDIGTWSSLFEHVPLDNGGNITTPNTLLYNTSNSVISASSDKCVVVSGLSDYIIVDSHDVLMICPRSEEQSIKNFIEDIKYKVGKDHV